jgi:ribosomal protein S18 acetylase RimI-like enzyme
VNAPPRVRPVSQGAEDRTAIARLLAATREFDPEEVRVALELVDHAIAHTDDYRVLVAELSHDSSLVGYVCFGPTPMTRGTFDLYWIATDPAQRRAGIGRALVAALADTLRSEGARLVRLETSSRDDYEATRRFYDGTGFHVAARIPDFYDVGDDLVIYTRALA